MCSAHKSGALWRAILCLLLVCVFFASACSSALTEQETQTVATQVSTTQLPVQAVPKRGGDLFIAIPEDVTSYDPLLATNEDLLDFYTLIYDTPFTYDDTGRLVNGLIDSWDVSADGRHFTFKIRDDVYFSDGQQLTAEDVYESARRALVAVESIGSPEGESTREPEDTASPDSSASPRPATLSGSEGSFAQRFANYGAQITSMDLNDDNTLSITTQDPGNAALHFLTFPVTKADFSAEDLPVGTGPYAVVDVNSDGQITLEVNPYWQGDMPYIERIVANPVTGGRSKIDMLQTSMLDFVTTDAINANNYAVSGRTKVVDYMTNYFDCLIPNLSNQALSDINVRRAISEALDRREILSTVLVNHGVPSTLPIEPDSFVVDTRFRSNQRDLAGALDKLEASGYRYQEDGEGKVLELELIVADSIENSYRKEAARAIKKQLAEAFIEVTVVTLSAEEFVSRLQSGSFDIAYCSFYLSPFPDLDFLFHRDGSANYGRFYDQQVEDALRDCDEAITEQELIDSYARLQELLNAYLPIIGLYFRMNSIICDESIQGMNNVREGTVFSDIESWYITTAMQQVEPQASASASATPRAATVPESRVTAAPTQVTPSQETPAFSYIPVFPNGGEASSGPSSTRGDEDLPEPTPSDEEAETETPTSEPTSEQNESTGEQSATASEGGDPEGVVTFEPGSIIIPPDSEQE